MIIKLLKLQHRNLLHKIQSRNQKTNFVISKLPIEFLILPLDICVFFEPFRLLIEKLDLFYMVKFCKKNELRMSL